MAGTKREIVGWAMFDFANSSYTTIVLTVVYPVFFTKVIAQESAVPKSLWSLAITLANIGAVIVAPPLGALIDRAGGKKRALLWSWIGCVVTTAALGWVGPGDVAPAIALVAASALCFFVGENLISSFLPELAAPGRIGRISGIGWAWGYVGGLASLGVVFPLVAGGIDAASSDRLRWVPVAVAVFFFAAALPTVAWLRERRPYDRAAPWPVHVRAGFGRVLHTLRDVRASPELWRFFGAFFLYIGGLSVVVFFASIFAEQEIGFNGKQLLLLFVFLQVSSSLGAFAFGWAQDRIGARRIVAITLVLWLAVVVLAFSVRGVVAFYAIANLAGLAIGATASASRAWVGLLAPEGRVAEMYGFMGLFWKLANAAGAAAFGVAADALGLRWALVVPLVLFGAGLFGVLHLRDPEPSRVPPPLAAE